MKKIRFILFILLFLILCLNVIQSISQKDEIIRKKYFNSNYLKTPNKEIQIEFNNEIFYLQWSSYDQNTSTLEFLRENETVNNYKQMITVVTPGSAASFSDFTNAYLNMLKPFQAQDPLIFKNDESKYEKEIIIDALLLDTNNDRVEHILVKIFVDENSHVNCIVFSTVLKFSDTKNNPDLVKNEIGAKRVNWLENLGKVYFITFS